MANRRHSGRNVKRLRTYDVREAAKVLGATPGTIRHWQKTKGLEAVSGVWPLIFRGADIIAFFKKRSSARKQRAGPGRIYCLKCREPKTPALGMAEYMPSSPRRGMLVGLCPDCAGLMYRATSPAKLKAAAGNLDVSLPVAQSNLTEMAEPISNHHSGRGV